LSRLVVLLFSRKEVLESSRVERRVGVGHVEGNLTADESRGSCL
jgi:hypothetical protein